MAKSTATTCCTLCELCPLAGGRCAWLTDAANIFFLPLSYSKSHTVFIELDAVPRANYCFRGNLRIAIAAFQPSVGVLLDGLVYAIHGHRLEHLAARGLSRYCR
jgi:hypothetical protein